jgi:diguanylate cyclase (GGDEF)-like protein
MPDRLSGKINLRRLILLFAAATALITLINSFYAAYRVQRTVLVENALEANRAYAAKVASSIGEYLQTSQQQLAYSAVILGRDFDKPAVLDAEVRRLREQDAGFTNIAVVNTSAMVLRAAPDSLQLEHTTLNIEGVRRALRERRPLVSRAYRSSAGELVVFISQPVLDPYGRYLGFVGGAIDLRKAGVLHTLISNHFYRESTQAYVVDSSRRLIYHPDMHRVGEVIGMNPVVDAVIQGQSGAMDAPNSQGVEMLAGYASVPMANWGVISQRPKAQTLAALDQLMSQMLLGVAPLSLIGFLGIWWVATFITRPLKQLAESAGQMDAPHTAERINAVRAWYVEAQLIKQALLKGFGLVQEKLGGLSRQAQTDPLTGLLNRRAMDQALETLESTRQAFSVIALDIDHFKQVNDTYGHDAGDVALSVVAQLMKGCSREVDLACRVGGEEFLLLLPGAPLNVAREVAERLRLSVAQTPIETVGHLTISLGVAVWPGHGGAIAEVLKQADELMYQAKQQGRNRSVMQQA